MTNTQHRAPVLVALLVVALLTAIATLPTHPAVASSHDPNAFITTWNTNLEAGTTVTLGLDGDVNATIDWGDSTVTTVNGPGPHVHDYGTNGTYTVSVSGTVTGYSSTRGGAITEPRKLISVDQWGNTGFTSLAGAFRGANQLTSLPTDGSGTGDVTDMSAMFRGAWRLQTVPLFDTSKVTNMADMFSGVSLLTSIPQFNTSNVTNMAEMFSQTPNLSTVPQFDTSNVTNMNAMFQTSGVTHVPLFDTSNVTNMVSMFQNATKFNGDLSGWCVPNILTEPFGFDQGANAWTLPDSRPVWGTCPVVRPPRSSPALSISGR